MTLFRLGLRRVTVAAILLMSCLATCTARGAEDLVASFQAECRDRAAKAAAAGVMTASGLDGWLFLDRELRHLSAGEFWGEAAAAANPTAKQGTADPLPAIVDFHAQLTRAGIELLLVPVPAKAVIYPGQLDSRFAGKAPRLDPHLQAFYKKLREAGVEVLDLTPAFLEHTRDSELGPLYCQQDSHWSGSGCILAASEISKALTGRPWRHELERRNLTSRPREISITGDLTKALANATPASEAIRLRFVSVEGDGAIRPVRDDRDSPIVLMGDSHNLVFHAGGADLHAAGAGLADQLALEFGVAVDVIAVRGSGATPARINLLRNARREGYLAKKKIVIWCFAAREFTESGGWPRIPIIP